MQIKYNFISIINYYFICDTTIPNTNFLSVALIK